MSPSDAHPAAPSGLASNGGETLSDDAIVDHLITRIQASKVFTEPYEFVIVSNALPEPFYRQVEAAYPSPNDGQDYMLETVKNRRSNKNDGYSEKRMSLNPKSLDPEVLAQIPDHIRQLFRIMTHKRLSNAMIAPFSATVNRMTRAHLERVGQKPGTHKVTLNHAVELIYDQTGFSLAPHTDGQSKVATALLYFPHPGDPEDMGTHIYSAKDPDALQPIHLNGKKALTASESRHWGHAPYRPNTMMLFARTEHSFHGVPVSASAQARRVVQAAINFTGGIEAV